MNREAGFSFGSNLRSVCVGTVFVKIVSIPISLLIANLLSSITVNATAGDVPAVRTNSLIVLIVMALFMVIRTWADAVIRKKSSVAGNKCRVDFLAVLLRNPLPKLFAADQGEFNENINDDIRTISRCYTELIPSVLSASLSVVIYLLFLARESSLVAVSLFAISLIQFIPPIIVKKYMQVNYDDCREIEAKITDHVVEAVAGYDMIKMYGLKQWWQEKLTAYHQTYLKVGNKSEATFAAQKAMFEAVDNILRFGTYALLGLYVIRGFCDLDVVVKAVYLSTELFAGVKALFETIPQFAVASTAKTRLETWENVDQPNEDAAQSAQSIGFQNVQYQIEDSDILHNINSQFQEHDSYLLTGDNGAGKSTLFHLLTGLVLPTSGQIAWKGSDTQAVHMSVSPPELFYLPQNDPVFHFSAETLFGMFDEGPQKEMYIHAAKFGLEKAHLTVPISELSGGERKKVYLSMAFGVSPHWLLLDEPTNSLDVEGKTVLAELIRSRQGVLIISHDPELQSAVRHTLTLKGGCLA